MGTHGLKIVRFRKRYYVYWNRLDSHFEGFGAEIVASIPEDPEEYQMASVHAGVICCYGTCP